jgi:chromosome segregation ATPase
MSKDWKTFWRTKMETMMGTKASEVPMVTTAAEKAEQLKSAIEGLQAQRAGLDRKRTDQLTAVRNAQTRRGHLVAQLAGADPKVAERLHTQINSVDTDIVTAQRLAESLEAGQSKADEEISALSVQLHEAIEMASRQEQAKKDEAARVQFCAIWHDIDILIEKLSIKLAEGVAGPSALALQERQIDFIHSRIGESFHRHRSRIDNEGWRMQHGVSPSLVVNVVPATPPDWKP